MLSKQEEFLFEEQQPVFIPGQLKHTCILDDGGTAQRRCHACEEEKALAELNEPFKPLVMHSSKRADWGTPAALFKKLDAEFTFGLDVAAEAHNTKCLEYYGPDHKDEQFRDGLAVDWWADANARYLSAFFMNPPYSRTLKLKIEPWLQKAVVESMKGLTVVGIIPANQQTRWWQTYVRAAYEVRFLTHRISFDPPPGVKASSNAGHNVAIVIWKPLAKLGYVKYFEPHYCYWSCKEENGKEEAE
jgi:phage N-6-adenine-methyltransferase